MATRRKIDLCLNETAEDPSVSSGDGAVTGDLASAGAGQAAGAVPKVRPIASIKLSTGACSIVAAHSIGKGKPQDAGKKESVLIRG